MFYIQRSNDGAIRSIAQQADTQHTEALPASDPQLKAFLDSADPSALGELQTSDAEFIRVLEDLIDLLVNKDLLQFTELPVPAQQKLLSRRQIRERLISHLSTSSTLLSDSPSDDSLI